jgi:hypothetical protein
LPRSRSWPTGGRPLKTSCVDACGPRAMRRSARRRQTWCR